MPDFHPLLMRQLKRNGIDLNVANIPADYLKLFEVISHYYKESDDGRYINARALDISFQEMHELRTRLQKEKELLQAVMSDGMCILDPLWRIKNINKTAKRILGCTNEKVVDGVFGEIFTLYENSHSQNEEITISMLLAAFKNDGHYDCDRGCVKNLKNNFIPVSFSINPLPTLTNGAFGGAVVIFKDISERIRTEMILRNAVEAAEKSSKAKGLFLANMSHEIRTPMNGILGMLQILMNTPLNEKQIGYTQKTYDSAESLLRIIGDILDLSKIDAGKVEFEHINFVLAKELEPLMALMTSQAMEKKINLKLHEDTEIPKILIGDPLRIKQIITNLISNAIKFTPENGLVTINIKKMSICENGVVLEIAVTDTGIGIPKDRQGAIFELFSQADESTSRKYGGTGLGLAIVKQLAEHMGGEVLVKSEEGKGSTF
jgi:signal transduction histidine kinase